MSNLTKITDELVAVVVPADSRKFRINEIQNEVGRTLYQMYYEYNITNISKEIKGVILDFSNVKILGTVSETEIDFDVKPFVDIIDEIDREEFMQIIYRDYVGDMVYYYSKNKSFHSLLKSKGITPTPETKIVILKKI